jgi:multidrug resistance efflux pump
MKSQSVISLLVLVFLLVLQAPGNSTWTTEAAAIVEDLTPIAAVTDLSPIAPVDTHMVQGVIEPAFSSELSFPVHGRVAEILVAVGEEVQLGQPVVRLDQTDAELVLQRARHQLAAAQARLSSANAQMLLESAGIETAREQLAVAQAMLAVETAGPSSEMVAVAQAGLAAADADVNYVVSGRDALLDAPSGAEIRTAEANLQAASTNRFAAQVAYDNILNNCHTDGNGAVVCPFYGPEEEKARARLQAAIEMEAAAQAYLNDLHAGPSGEERAVADAAVNMVLANRAVTQAEYDLYLLSATPTQVAQSEHAITVAELLVQTAETRAQAAAADVKRSEADVAAAMLHIESAEHALAQLTREAPQDGVVTRVNVQAGEFVAPGQTVVSLADPQGWVVRTLDLSEIDVVDVEPGLAVQIRFDALPDVETRGEIVYIADMPELVDREVIYEVVVQIKKDPSAPLAWGMTALVSW